MTVLRLVLSAIALLTALTASGFSWLFLLAGHNYSSALCLVAAVVAVVLTVLPFRRSQS